ncbi:hypothetical protein WA538_005670, partial [Blastocystis sp. DL]
MSVSFYSETELQLSGDRSGTTGNDDHIKNPLNVVCIVNGPIRGNAYVVWETNHPSQAILIDPGEEETKVYDEIQKRGLTIRHIYLTHGHSDHSSCIGRLQSLIGVVPVHIHTADAYMIRSYVEKAQEMGLTLQILPLRHNEAITVGDRVGKCLYSPGHTMGGMCFLFDRVLFSGDTLFFHGVGRTDLKGGDHQKLIATLGHLRKLAPSTFVLCGHNRPTTIFEELY